MLTPDQKRLIAVFTKMYGFITQDAAQAVFDGQTERLEPAQSAFMLFIKAYAERQAARKERAMKVRIEVLAAGDHLVDGRTVETTEELGTTSWDEELHHHLVTLTDGSYLMASSGTTYDVCDDRELILTADQKATLRMLRRQELSEMMDDVDMLWLSHQAVGRDNLEAIQSWPLDKLIGI